MHRRTLFIALGLLVILLLSAESVRAAGLLMPRDGGAPIGVRSHRVVAVVEDGLATTTLRQTFVNSGERAVEAVYLFPLPEGAALTAVAMETGGQRLEGLLVERKQARRIYDDIVRTRRDPALVEQVGRNVFRLSVFPVLPRVETVVELTWVERVPLSQGVFRYVYPLSLAEDGVETENDFTISVTMRSSATLDGVSSPTGDMEVVPRSPREAVASLERVRAKLDRDVVVEARVRVELPELAVSTFRGPRGEGWFLAVVTPPEARPEDLIPRDVILVVDTSGSMMGGKIEQAKAVALWLLGNLRPADRVNVLRFSSDCRAFAPEAVPVSPDNIAKLREFVAGFEANGGTALGDALRQSLDVPAVEGRVRTVVMLTDGLPTLGEQDPAKIVAFARDGAARGLRVFPFGVGDDVNPALLQGIARAGRGRAEIFRPEEETAGRLTTFLARTASPVLSDVSLAVEGVGVHDLFPRPVPDGYLGEQVVFAGRYSGGGEAKVIISALLGDRRVALTESAEFRAEPGGRAMVAALFGREKLAFLEEALRLRSGLSDDAYYAALDRGAYSTADEIVSEIVAVSLEHGIQSAYASWLVLLPEDRARIDPRDAAQIAGALERARLAKAAVAPEGYAPGEDGEAPDEVAEVGLDRRRESTRTGPHVFGRVGSSGHGGAYRGPGGEVPPGSRDPKDPQPAPESTGSPSPGAGPGGGTLPADGPRPAGPAPAPSSPGAMDRGRAAPSEAVSFADWRFWWAYNRDALLSARDLAAGRAPIPADVVAEKVLPALDATLACPDVHPANRRAAVIAMARAGGRTETLLRIARAEDPLFEDVRDAGVLALALDASGDAKAIAAALTGLLDDAGLSVYTRSTAAIALGLRGGGDAAVFEALKRQLLAPIPPPVEFSVPILVAMGLTGGGAPGVELAGWISDGRIGARRLVDLERAHLVIALSRAGAAPIGPVLEALRRKEVLARRSAMIALGRMIPAEPAADRGRLVEVLARALSLELDESARGFGLVSLGRIGAHPDVSEAVRKACLGPLLAQFGAGDPTPRSYAALGLGLLAGEVGDVALRGKIAARLREHLAAGKGGPEFLGATALALGLSGDRSAGSVDLLLGLLIDRGQGQRLRSAAAEALGLLGDARAAPALLAALGSRTDRDLRVETAPAAGLLAGAEALPDLLAMFDDPKSSGFELGAAAEAIGRLGDVRAVPELIRILEPGRMNGAYPDLYRMMAATALGLLCERPESRLLHRLSADLNCRAMVPALENLLRAK
jgi:Ca-activated chloride channel family protein